MAYTVQPADSDNLSAIMQIEQHSFADEIMEAAPVFADRLVYAQGCNYILRETPSAAVCGYITAEIWNASSIDDNAFELGHCIQTRHYPAGTVLYISSFALHPALRGKKITVPESLGASTKIQISAAKFLFSTAIKNITTFFPQLERILLLVHEDWHNAIRIYESQGFKQIRVLDRFTGFGNKRAFIYETLIPASGLIL